MPCYHPLLVHYQMNPVSHKKELLWSYPHGRNSALDEGQVLHIPCGQCVGCRLEKSRVWAARCVCEAQMHEHNSFLTLTYDDEHLVSQSLIKKHLQDFMKRLRRNLEYDFGDSAPKLRFFSCGEYGSKHLRPHFHVLLFGFDFSDDRQPFQRTKHGNILYISNRLSKLWPFGFHTIGELTFESCAYTARYVMKKQTGKGATEYYENLGIEPEFTLMSRRPGIGAPWFEKFHADVYSNDFLVIRDGIKMMPPKYFDDLLERSNSNLFADIKERRELVVHKSDTWERQAVKEKVKQIKADCLHRSYEESEV